MYESCYYTCIYQVMKEKKKKMDAENEICLIEFITSADFHYYGVDTWSVFIIPYIEGEEYNR